MTDTISDEAKCLIPLTKGYSAIVDKEDYKTLSKFKWNARPDKTGVVYAGRLEYIKGEKGNGTQLLMHRVIMNAQKGQMIDHINGNGLDNRKANLRFCNGSQNQGNKRKSFGTSKYKGVFWYKQTNSWASCIRVNNKKTHLGYFKSEEEAALAYNNEAINCFGDFAKLNVIPSNHIHNYSMEQP